MGYFRLFRRIKIAPGVTINVSKSGLSTSFGPRGAKVTVGRRGIRKTVGIPGTGLYYTSVSGPGKRTVATPSEAPASNSDASASRGIGSWAVILIGVVILAAMAGSCLGGRTAETSPSAPPAALGLLGHPSPRTETPMQAVPAAPESTTTASLATEKPAPTTLSVNVTARTATVSRNSTASVSIKTSPKADCSIEVDYRSGPSTAAGLADKTATSSGAVTWSWKVGSNTARGTWPIYVSCELGSRSGTLDTSITVQ